MSAGGLVGYGLLLFIALLFIGLLGGVVDQLVTTNNAMVSTSTMPVSQDRVDTMKWLVYGFAAIPIMVILAGGYNYWITNIRDANQEV